MPAPPLSLANLLTPPTADEWNDVELQVAATLGLPTTAWQEGQPERTVFAVVANTQQQADVAASICIQAGWLDFAATGSVTYTNADGEIITQYVTPDPSNPAQNPTGALGWLDVLALNVFNVTRILLASAGGDGAILNTSASTYGAFEIGTYHISQPDASGEPTYSNTASLTIPPSTSVGTMTGATNASPIVVTLASHGLTDGDAVFITGTQGNTAANGAWYVTVVNANSFSLDGSTGNGAWTSGGAVYEPTVAAFTADVAGTASDADDPNVVTEPVTSLIGVSVANLEPWIGSDTESNTTLAARCRLKLASLAIGGPGGAYVYFALVAQQLAPELTPAQAVSAQITRALVSLDVLTGFAYLTIANAAGAVSGSFDVPGTDVYAVHSTVVANAGITAFTLITRSAAAKAVTVVIRVYLPAGYNTDENQALFENAVEAYFRALPIGGVTDPSGDSPNTNVVPYNAVLASVNVAAATAQIPIQQVEGTLDGGTANIQLDLTPVPEVAEPSVTLTLVSV